MSGYQTDRISSTRKRVRRGTRHVQSARLPSRRCTLERGGHRNREAPAPERWWAMAFSRALERDAPVISNAGLSLLTTQCRFFEGARGPRLLVPSSLVVTSAALAPGSLRLETTRRAGGHPRSLDCLRSSKSEMRHLVTPSGARRYSAVGLDAPAADRGSTAYRSTRWISIPPPFVTGSCRRVDLDLAAKWICLSPPLKASASDLVPPCGRTRLRPRDHRSSETD